MADHDDVARALDAVYASSLRLACLAEQARQCPSSPAVTALVWRLVDEIDEARALHLRAATDSPGGRRAERRRRMLPVASAP